MTPEDASAELSEQLKEDIETWECQTVEFKKRATSDHEIAEAIAGFATSNSGRIYIGVGDDGQITGVDAVSDGMERDAYQRRIAHISRDLVKPPIRVKVDFIETESRTVVRIDVPKGEEPAYFVDYRPYTRDLSITRKLEPTELKSLYQQHFLSTLGPPPDEESTKYFIELMSQISDIQMICSDYMDHLIKPDFYQLKYDIGATARRLSILSANQYAKNLGIDTILKELGRKLEDAEAHEFYLGMKSVEEFGNKLQDCLKLSNRLYEQIKKNAPPLLLPNFKLVVSENIELLKSEWNKSDKYLQRGEIEKLRDAFRRYGYTFHRLASLQDADKYGLSIELKEIGESLRKLSSTQNYFLLSMGVNPLDKIKPEMVQIMDRLEACKERLD